jgi:hypothetical protein
MKKNRSSMTRLECNVNIKRVLHYVCLTQMTSRQNIGTTMQYRFTESQNRNGYVINPLTKGNHVYV